MSETEALVRGMWWVVTDVVILLWSLLRERLATLQGNQLLVALSAGAASLWLLRRLVLWVLGFLLLVVLVGTAAGLLIFYVNAKTKGAI